MQALHVVKYTMYCVHTPSQLTSRLHTQTYTRAEMLEKNNPKMILYCVFG